MKTRFYALCLATISLLLLNSCKKDNSATSTDATANFSPLTTATNWTYKITEGTAAPYTFKSTVTSRDTAANSKTYKVISNSDGTTGYLAKAGNDYYRFASFPAIGINSFEELYLKDNKALNETWAGTTSFTYAGQNITANLAYTIKGKGETRTVSGTSFSNVTHVRLDIAVFGSVIGGGDFYYQDGVGLIEDDILVSPPFGSPYSSKEEIISYEIK